MTETLLAINASPHVYLLDLCQSLHALSGNGLDSVWLLFGCVLMHARTVHKLVQEKCSNSFLELSPR